MAMAMMVEEVEVDDKEVNRMFAREVRVIRSVRVVG
jgi:hypothetical protein